MNKPRLSSSRFSASNSKSRKPRRVQRARLAALEHLEERRLLATLVHDYPLNGSFADELGGPAMTDNGGALGATGYTFGQAEGPRIENWATGTATADNYSVEFLFEIDDTAGYKKLVTFTGADTGLYNNSGNINFFNATGNVHPGTFANDRLTHLVVSRNGTTGDVQTFINGTLKTGASFNDGGGIAIFTGANDVIDLLQDEGFHFGENPTGFVDFVRIYDGPLTGSEVYSNFLDALRDRATVTDVSTESLTGVDLLNHPDATFPSSRSLTPNGTSVDVGAGGGSNEVAIRLPLAAPGQFANDNVTTVRVSLDVTAITGDNDLGIAISDGSNTIGAEASTDNGVAFPFSGADNGATISPSFQSDSDSTPFSQTYELEFVLVGTGDSRVMWNVSGESDFRVLSPSLNVADGLDLILMGDGAGEQYRINSVDFTVSTEAGAAGDQLQTDAENDATLAAPGVLANDLGMTSITAVNGAPGDVGSLVTLASGATITLAADGGLSYSPNSHFGHLGAGESATDNFTYTASDGVGGTSTATVSVTVTGLNTAPTPGNDTGATNEGGPATNSDISANDVDPDSSLQFVTELAGTPVSGALSAAGLGAYLPLDAAGSAGVYADATGNGNSATPVSGTQFGWTFDDATITADTQSGGEVATNYFDAAAAGVTSFGNTGTDVVVPDLADGPANFLHFTPFLNGGAGGYPVDWTNVPANGGGSLVNTYTVVVDMFIPSLNWTAIFNTNFGHGNDADFYVNPSGALGIGALGYSAGGVVQANQWHRIGFTHNHETDLVKYWVDGAEVFSGAAGGIDGRHSLYTSAQAGNDFVFFGEGDTSGNYSNEAYVSSMYFANTALSDTAMQALAGPSAAGVQTSSPAEVAGPTGFGNAIFLNQAAHDAAGGTAPITNTIPEYLTLNDGGNLQFGDSDNFSVLYWFNAPRDQSGDPSLISNKDWASGGNQGWNVSLNDSGNGDDHGANLGDGSDRADPAPFDLAFGDWNLGALVVDRGTDTATLYTGIGAGTLNVSSASIANVGDLSTPAGNSINIGQDGTGSYGLNHVGLVDDVSLWNRALSQVEIQAVLDGGLAGQTLADLLQSSGSVTLPSGATAVLNVDGTVDYDPNGQFESLADGQTANDSFTYVVSDGNGTGQATVDVTIAGENDAPAADVGGPYTVIEAGSVTLDASASSDIDTGTTLTYSWDINNDGVFGDATGVGPTVDWATLVALSPTIDDGPSSWDVSVEVSDGIEMVVSSTTTLTVTNANPTTGISGPTTGVANQAISFTVTTSDPSPADEAAGFTHVIDWGDGSGIQTVGPGAATTENVDHLFPGLGTYTVTLTTTDKDGGLNIATLDVEIVPVAVVGNNIFIGGTDDIDRIIVQSAQQDSVFVRYNNVRYGPFDVSPISETHIFGGGSNDRISISSCINTMIDGGAGNDNINGGPCNDVIFGRDGTDTILTGEGDNWVDAGSGNDSVFSRSGEDVLYGGLGNDVVSGGSGQDMLFGGIGNDRIFAGGGADLLSGGVGNDILIAGSGHDVLIGNVGNDTVRGNNGDDLLVGGTDRDAMQGGRGRDLLIGGVAQNEDDESALSDLLLQWSISRFTADLGTVGDDGDIDALVAGGGFDSVFVGTDDLADIRANDTALSY
jgi:VCBS repeat-containing protein